MTSETYWIHVLSTYNMKRTSTTSGDLISQYCDNHSKKDLFFIIGPRENDEDIVEEYEKYLKFYYKDKNMNGLVTGSYMCHLDQSINFMERRTEELKRRKERIMEDTKKIRQSHAEENKKKRHLTESSVKNVVNVGTISDNTGRVTFISSIKKKEVKEPPYKKRRSSALSTEHSNPLPPLPSDISPSFSQEDVPQMPPQRLSNKDIPIALVLQILGKPKNTDEDTPQSLPPNAEKKKKKKRRNKKQNPFQKKREN